MPFEVQGFAYSVTMGACSFRMNSGAPMRNVSDGPNVTADHLVSEAKGTTCVGWNRPVS